MIAHINDVIDQELLHHRISEKMIVLREHPNNSDIVIANYSQLAQYTWTWDEATTAARGLIFNRSTGEVIARPWNKFFAHDHDCAPDTGKFTNIEVTDKMDGSLIVGYYDENNVLRGATKGSFSSEMVPVANEFLAQYGTINNEWTPLFEVIYPQNRIVVDYGDTRDLFVLGAVHKKTGKVVGPNDSLFDNWTGPRTRSFTYKTLDEAINQSPRENSEGLIIRDIATGTMVKMKQEDYIIAHAYATEVTTLTIWEALSKGTYNELLESVPDELYDELRSQEKNLKSKFKNFTNDINSRIDSTLEQLDMNMDSVKEGDNRKAFVLKVKNENSNNVAHRIISATFNRDTLNKMAWQNIRPYGEEVKHIGKTFNRKKNRVI